MDSALCRIFLLNAKCTQMGSSLLPTLNKTQEDTNKIRRSKSNTRPAKGKTYQDYTFALSIPLKLDVDELDLLKMERLS